MNLLNSLLQQLELGRRERAVYRELARLDDRDLSDIGLGRSDIRDVARLAARHGRLDLHAWRELVAATTADVAPPRPVGQRLQLRPV